MSRRALGEKEKEARRNDILAHAARLILERPYDAIRMSDLASELDLAKGTLYLYFPSKEALFLALLQDRLSTALERVVRHLRSETGLSRDDAIDGVARETAAAMADDPVLPLLLALVHAILEKNVPVADATAFNRGLAAFIAAAGAELGRIVPGLDVAGASRFFLYLYAETVGLVQLRNLSSFIERLPDEPGLAVFRVGLEPALRESARCLLRGIMAERGGAPPDSPTS